MGAERFPFNKNGSAELDDLHPSISHGQRWSLESFPKARCQFVWEKGKEDLLHPVQVS